MSGNETLLKHLPPEEKLEEEFVSFLARESRSLPENREAARLRLAALIASAKKSPRKRRPTKPTRASKERRLSEKSRRSEIKSGRGRVDF